MCHPQTTWCATPTTGLPGDDVTIENIVMITKAATTRPVMLIDPVETASTWLVKHLQSLHTTGAAPPIEEVAGGDPRFLNTLELAVRFGKWLVVHDVDGIEPLLVPLLRKELVQNGGGWTVALGDKMVDYHRQFRLFLVSRDSTLVLQPNVAPLLLVANFAITRYAGGLLCGWFSCIGEGGVCFALTTCPPSPCCLLSCVHSPQMNTPPKK